MAIKPISAPTVSRRNLAASTSTIRRTDMDTGIRPQQAELMEVLRMRLSTERFIGLTGAVASAQDNINGRQQWGLGTDATLSSFDQEYEDSIFWSYWDQFYYVAAAAAVSSIACVQEAGGKHQKEVFNPGIIVAASQISLYDIGVETDALFTYTAFGWELMTRLVQVDAATLAALLSRGDLFI